MANAKFNGDGAVASPPARVLVRVVDDDGRIVLLPPPHLLMEGDEDIGAMAKASALTNVAIARNAAAALLALMGEEVCLSAGVNRQIGGSDLNYMF